MASTLPGIIAIAASIAIYFGAFGSSAIPENPTPAEVNAYVMSPFCPGLTLEECPSVQAGELRSEIAKRLADGSSGPQIEDWLVSTYGEAVLGRPRRVGVFVLPAILLALGGAFVVWDLRSRKVAPIETPRSVIPDPDAQRLERELEAFAGGTE